MDQREIRCPQKGIIAIERCKTTTTTSIGCLYCVNRPIARAWKRPAADPLPVCALTRYSNHPQKLSGCPEKVITGEQYKCKHRVVKTEGLNRVAFCQRGEE